MLKFTLLIPLLLLITLQHHTWKGKGSHEEYDMLQHMIAQQRQENITLQSRNDDLRTDIIDLKTGLNAIEERARLELGLIKPNEVFYQLVE